MKTFLSRYKQNASANQQGEATDLGLGIKDTGKGNRAINKDGSFNVVKKGSSFFKTNEVYHNLISMSWTKFFLLITSGYVVINLIFAGLYLEVGFENLLGAMGNSSKEKFLDAFFFSSQTLTTLGYGRISPVGTAASAIAAIESMIGLLGFAMATGLLYGRFSRPEAKILYSHNAVIAPYKEQTAIMFRIANERKNQLIEIEASVTLSYKSEVPNTRRFFNLKLEISKINFFPLSWTIVHPINEESPLYGLTEQEVLDLDAELIILLKGFDDAFSQTVYSRNSYKCHEFIWGAKFKSMFELGKESILHLDKINEFEPVALPVMAIA